MRRIVFVLVGVAALAGVVAYMAPASGQADGEAAPIFGVKISPGYRDWRLISVAHEEGNLNDLRAILGNDVAIEASRVGRQRCGAQHLLSCQATIKARDLVCQRYAP
jgi:hypothetical protein